jgi:hypothetical protein
VTIAPAPIVLTRGQHLRSNFFAMAGAFQPSAPVVGSPRASGNPLRPWGALTCGAKRERAPEGAQVVGVNVLSVAPSARKVQRLFARDSGKERDG